MNWVQDHLLEVLRPGLAERVFSDGEYLIRQGDQGTHLLYILEGTVEVLLKLSNPRNDRRQFSRSWLIKKGALSCGELLMRLHSRHPLHDIVAQRPCAGPTRAAMERVVHTTRTARTLLRKCRRSLERSCLQPSWR